MTEYEFSGKTVDEAVENGLKTLGLTREEAEIRVLEEGKKGGLFSKGTPAVEDDAQKTKKTRRSTW